MGHYIPETALADYMYLEKRDEEDLPTSKTALTQRFKNYIEKHERGLITAIRKDTDTIDCRMTITGKEKWRKNNSMDTLKVY